MSTTAAPNRLIEQFRQLGLNTYEAKVYIALLGKHPATGYEVSKSSSVPQARAYDTLKALESKNMVVSMGGKPQPRKPQPSPLAAALDGDPQGSGQEPPTGSALGSLGVVALVGFMMARQLFRR